MVDTPGTRKNRKGLPPETPFDDIVVRIKKSLNNPNVKSTNCVVLKEGPQAFRIATLFEIVNPATGALHHYFLKIDSINRRKDGWFYKPEKSVTLEGKEPNEIEKLLTFLTAHTEGKFKNRTGELHIIGSDDYAKLEQLMGVLHKLPSNDKIELVKAILPHIDGNAIEIEDFVAALKDSDTATVNNLGIAARIVEYRKSYEIFETLVNDDSTSESALQKYLEANPWMFGSEYSKLEDKHQWTRDNKLDFMLRRTVDDYLEIVEIKRPIKAPLLKFDDSHSSWYPSSGLSKVLGQVMRYIEEAERYRDNILAKDNCDTLKIKARIIVGRDGVPDHQAALRNFNAHIHRIEIITYDQLLRIANRVLSVFKTTPSVNSEEPEHSTDDDDLPF